MNSTAMAQLLDADDLGIARVSRGVIMTVAQSNENAVNPNRGKPPKDDDGGDGTEATCDQTLGWNISRVTPMTQNAATATDACKVVGASGGDAIDYAASTLKICVLDTGVSFHSDLNVVGQFNTSSTTDNPNDIYGHGTHVAGIIGALAYGDTNTENYAGTNEDIGVVGVAPGAPITSIKVLGDDGSGSDFDVIAGIDMALFEGCDIVNMSLGGSKSIPLDAAIWQASSIADPISNSEVCEYPEYKYDRKGNIIGETGNDLCLTEEGTPQNIIFTLAAGNSGADIEGYSPARTSTSGTDNIFTIASFGEGDVWSSFSNYGEIIDFDETASMVDFALPGENIRSTVLDDKYDSYNGTSMAAPHMAGLLVRYIDRTKDDLDVNGNGFNDTYDCVDDDGNVVVDRRCVNNIDIDTVGTVTGGVKIGRFVADYGTYKIAIDDGP